jgi:N-acyl-D-amino-acid deacylase
VGALAEEVLAKLFKREVLDGVRPVDDEGETFARRGGGRARRGGTFPRKLREYVYRRKLISLPFAIRSGSALTAESLRLPERGLLRAGYFADVIVFDEKTVADRATYERPRTLAAGMRYVIVNGKISVEDGTYNGALNGRPLRKTP